ncbi:MAG: GTP-binding protein [Promethearchaeota archaeon]
MAKNYIFKICCCGDGSVGKTSMVLRYSEEKFQESYIMTIGSNFATKSIEFDNNISVKLQIWDLAGQQHFSFVRPPFYRGASGSLFIFDITRRASFENIQNWKQEVEEVIKKPFILVGNKLDLSEERVISRSEAEKLAKELGALGYFETSAKSGKNLDSVFMTLVNKILKRK